MIVASLLLMQQFVHEETSSYKQLLVNGFTVRVSSEAQKHPETTNPAIELIKTATKQISKMIPKNALEVIRRAPIWIEHMNPDFPSMCYHPNAEWLRANKYNVAKENSVEVANAKNFVAWTKLNQPFQLFHEFAHAYHDLKFGFDDAYIKACYDYAVSRGSFDSVDYKPSGKRRHYALTNQMEYFAEMSEAYFGENDFYPFNREQLKQADPKGYTMIEYCWGVGK